MSGWHPPRPPRPPWDTQEQPTLPAEGTWYGAAQGPRVIIKPHEPSGRGGARAPGFSGPPRGRNRKIIAAGTVIGLAVAVGLVAGAVYLTHVTWGEHAATPTPVATTSQNATTQAVTPTTSATTGPGGTATGSGSPGPVSYVLSAPATAGGYSRTTPVAATVAAIGSGGATELMTAVKADGGKVTSDLNAEYVIVSDQVLGYAGYNGSFSPAAVIKNFQAGATGVTSQSAGPARRPAGLRPGHRHVAGVVHRGGVRVGHHQHGRNGGVLRQQRRRPGDGPGGEGRRGRPQVPRRRRGREVTDLTPGESFSALLARAGSLGA